MSVVVVQCELQSVDEEKILFVSRELGGKQLYCRREHFNGKFEVTEFTLLRNFAEGDRISRWLTLVVALPEFSGSCSERNLSRMCHMAESTVSNLLHPMIFSRGRSDHSRNETIDERILLPNLPDKEHPS